jgi:hypothetical protein
MCVYFERRKNSIPSDKSIIVGDIVVLDQGSTRINCSQEIFI